MSINKDTCWYDSKSVPEQMLLGAKGVLWPVLEKSDHFPVLNTLMSSINNDAFTLLDIGCGAAEISRIYPSYYYTGADLAHIIKEVARKMHPQNSYVSFDIYEDDCHFIKDYDLVVMNAFIDVLEKPVTGLTKVLTNAPKYVLMHRQTFNDEKETHLYKYPSYGGVDSYQSVINRKEYSDLQSQAGFEIVNELRLDFNPEKGYTSSILMRKK
tara:strand:- start:1237 stop:1872 length:636 start_codon:yes stop_codon:yes gene_type:complete